MTDGGSGSEGPDRPVNRRSVSASDLIVATALLALLAFAPLAHLAAAAQPLAPEIQPRLATLTGNQPNRLVRDLPADLPDGFTAGSPVDLRTIARQALGQRGSRRLLTLLAPTAKSLQETAVGGRLGYAPYPYRYPAMTRLLDQAPGRAYTAEARKFGGRPVTAGVATGRERLGEVPQRRRCRLRGARSGPRGRRLRCPLEPAAARLR
jgi:hypothetical protein